MAPDHSGQKKPRFAAASFLQDLAGVLEVASIGAGEDFHAVPLWGSLTAFALKVMLSQRYAAALTLKEIDSCASAGELMDKVIAAEA